MTNPTKETLELVLKVAREVYPDNKCWIYDKWKTVCVVGEGQYEPHKDTERGKAQLMDLVNSIVSKEGWFKFGKLLHSKSDNSGGRFYWDVEAILKLYLETNRKA